MEDKKKRKNKDTFVSPKKDEGQNAHKPKTEMKFAERRNEILESLKKHLDTKRYMHTIGVAYTATSLAMRYEIDIQKAELAGLLHDCAKYETDEWKLSRCEKYGIELNLWERKNPALIHAKLGAYYTEHRYGIEDEEIISAVRKHTTGSPDMTMLEKIIYVSDYIEPGRKMLLHLPQIRKMAFTDIDEAIYMIAGDTLNYLSADSENIDPMTEETFRYYEGIHKEKNL